MSFWKDKVVLVTGGHGFVGTHVVKMLRDEGCREVHAPSRYEYDLNRGEMGSTNVCKH